MTPPALSRLLLPPGPAGVTRLAGAVRRMLAGTESSLEVVPSDRPPPTNVTIGFDAPAIVVPTSGSTGAPRRVVLPLSALLASADRGSAALGQPGRWLTTIPVTGVGGVLTIVRSLRAGFDPVAWSGVGGAEPFTAASFSAIAGPLLKTTQSTSVPVYVSLVPTQLRRILADPATAAVLAEFTAVLVGGSRLPTDLRQAAEVAGVRVVATYGATETAGGVVFDGKPLPDVTVTLEPEPADDTDTGDEPNLGHELDTGFDPEAGVEAGVIVIGGPTVAAGYLDDPHETSFVPHGFRTGDRGEWRGGRLIVNGRIDDIIKVGGVKVSLNAITNVLRSDPRVRDAHVIARPSSEWGQVPHAFVVLRDPGTADPSADLVEAVGLALGRRSQPPTMAVVPEIPVTVAGKPIRREI